MALLVLAALELAHAGTSDLAPTLLHADRKPHLAVFGRLLRGYGRATEFARGLAAVLTRFLCGHAINVAPIEPSRQILTIRASRVVD